MKSMEKVVPEKIYKEIVKYAPLIWVDLVVNYGQKILLLKRKNQPEKNKWWFPGGRVLKNENLWDAVKRKLQEETGLKAKKIVPLGLYHYHSHSGILPHINTDGIVVVFSTSITNNDKVVLDYQSLKYHWFKDIESGFSPYIKEFMSLRKKVSGGGQKIFSKKIKNARPIFLVKKL